MNYKIHITRTAERDLIEAADYIEFVLYNPTAADALLDTAEDELRELEFMPEKHSLVNDPVLKSWGIRFTIINNYLAFYVIKEEEGTVYIVRFLYERRDWNAILRKGLNLD